MPFNLLIFPLAGGYYFFVRFHYFRYLQHRADSQRLLFNSVIAGITLLIVSYFIQVAVEKMFPGCAHVLAGWLPLKIPYFGISTFTFLLAIAITEITNLFTKKVNAVAKAIAVAGNELEILFMQSFKAEQVLQITLKNNKFYIGWVSELPVPSKSNYIKIIPMLSGYRDEKKELVFTTEYLGVYASYVREGKVKDIFELKTNIIIKIDEIITANLFDMEMYERFHGLKEDGNEN